jgi:hypothetical protein
VEHAKSLESFVCFASKKLTLFFSLFFKSPFSPKILFFQSGDSYHINRGADTYFFFFRKCIFVNGNYSIVNGNYSIVNGNYSIVNGNYRL